VKEDTARQEIRKKKDKTKQMKGDAAGDQTVNNSSIIYH
jgi:hypothetical protein